jgi:tRNA nucleotidyltransferase (CCA-adding enzyme)
VVDALHTIGTEGEAIEEYLATPDNLPPSRIYNILSRIPPEVVLFLMARTGEDVVRRRISLYFDRLYTVRTAVSGDDLREMGVPEGPVYREILGGVLAARLDGEVKSKDEELTLACSLWGKALER